MTIKCMEIPVQIRNPVPDLYPHGSQVFTINFIPLKQGSPVAGVPYFTYF